jgi:hypothetical protein
MTDVEAALEIAKHLERGEPLLWSGGTQRLITFGAGELFLVPFTFAWCAGAIAWERSMLESDLGWYPSLIGIPFVAVGLYLFIGRFIHVAKVRAGTAYGLTNRRAIIIQGAFRRCVASVPLRDMPRVDLTEHRDGTGTITLGQKSPYSRTMPGVNFVGKYELDPYKFEYIANARDVYRRICELRQ